MRVRRRGVVMALLGVALSGCGDATGVEIDDLEGTWDATVLVAINPANTAQTQDLIAIGLGMEMVIGEGGSARLTIVQPQETEVLNGTIETVGDSITMVLGPSTSRGTIRRDGDTIFLELQDGIEWDFEGTGIEVPVTLRLEFVRTG